MFRAILSSSSGGQIVLVQDLVSSLETTDHSLVSRGTIADAVIIQFDLLKMSLIVLETRRGIY